MEFFEWLDYWKVYVVYQGVIYLMVIKDQEGVLVYLDKGLVILEFIDKFMDEEYVFMGFLYSLLIIFKFGEVIGFFVKVRKSFNKVLKKNLDNLCVLLGIGRLDYYKLK